MFVGSLSFSVVFFLVSCSNAGFITREETKIFFERFPEPSESSEEMCDLSIFNLFKTVDGIHLKSDCWTLLEMAVNKNFTDSHIIDYLISHIACPIHRAVKLKNMEIFNILLDANVRVNSTDINRQTPLHIASRFGLIDVARRLISRDPELVHATDMFNWYPIHIASLNGHCTLVKILIENGASSNALSNHWVDSNTTEPSYSPLYWSSRFNHIDCVLTLLANGADINQCTVDGYTSLHVASQFDHLAVVKTLLEHDALTSLETKDGLTALEIAAVHNNKDMALIISLSNYTEDSIKHAATSNNPKALKVLLNFAIPIKIVPGQPSLLHIAVRENYVSVAKILLKHQPSLVTATDLKNHYPLHYASIYQRCRMISLLLKHKADVNALATFADEPVGRSPSVSALQMSSKGDNTDCIRRLLDAGANINHQDNLGQTSLHAASSSGSYDVIKMLVEAGANTSLKTPQGATPLGIAILGGRDDRIVHYLANHTKNAINSAISTRSMKLFKYLISNHYNVLAKDDNGDTPLHVAVGYGYTDAVKILVQYKPILINTPGNNHGFPIHTAALNGKCEILSYLLKHHADPNAVAKYANDLPTEKPSLSSLTLASRYGHLECVKILLNAESDINQQDSYGFTALHFSAINNHYDIVKILVEFGANTSIKTNAGFTALEKAATNEDGTGKQLFNQAGNITFIPPVSNDIIEYLAHHTKNPVALAVRSNNINLLKFLVHKNLPLNTPDGPDENTPLHIAIRNKYNDAAEILLKHNPSLVNLTNKYHYFPIHFAMWTENCEIIPALRKRHANVNALIRFVTDDTKQRPSVTPLYIASRLGLAECVKKLIKAGADINRQTHEGYTAYLIAAENGQFEVLKMLVEAGADTSAKTIVLESALNLAFRNDRVNYTFIRYIVDHTKNMSALRYGSQGAERLKILVLQHFGDLNKTDEEGHTPLHRSIMGEDIDATKILIEEAPALVNVPDKHHWFPLHMAALSTNLCNVIVPILLNNSADINALANFYDDPPTVKPSLTALFLAAMNGHKECMKVLLEAGIDVNHKADTEATALDMAVGRNDFDAVKMLVEADADVNLKTKDGLTPLERAKNRKEPNKMIIKYLKDHLNKRDK